LARPVLSHFIGRKVEKVEPGDKIQLEGDANILAEDNSDFTDDLVGKILTNVILSSGDTVLLFAMPTVVNGQNTLEDEQRVIVDPLKYQIETEEYKPFNPTRAQELESGAEIAPDDPSPERIFEGPPRGPETGAEPIPEVVGDQTASEDSAAVEEQTEPQEEKS